MIIKLQNKESKITLLELLKDNYFSKDLIKKLKQSLSFRDCFYLYYDIML